MEMVIPFCIIIASLISLLMIYTGYKNRMFYMGLWGFGWFSFAAKCIFDYIFQNSGGMDIYLFISISFMFLAVGAFYMSIFVYSGIKLKAQYYFVFFPPLLLDALFILTGNHMYMNGFFIILGIEMISIAWEMHRVFAGLPQGKFLTVIGNTMMGIIMIGSPFVYPELHFGNLYYFLNFAAIIIVSSGFALIYFEDGLKRLKEENSEIRLLKDKLERDKFLLDQSSDALFVSTMSGDIVEVNKTAINRYGYTKEELLKLKASDIRKGMSLEMLLLQMNYYAENRELFEALHYCKDGRTIPVEVLSSIVKIGNEEYIISSARDTSDRKRTEAELIKLSRAVEQSGSAVVITDVNGIIEYVNPKFTMASGYSKEEALGKNPKILKSGLQTKELYERMWGDILSGKTWVGEVQNLTKFGDIYWALLNITPVKNFNGEITNFIAIQENITELKELQKELVEKNYEMRELFDKLAATQVQMLQQEKLAGIGHLAAGVAHEVNNPLGYITSNFETLRKYTEMLRNLVSELIDKETSDGSSTLEMKGLGLELKQSEKLKYIINELPEMFSDIEIGLSRIRVIVQSLRNFSRIDSFDAKQVYDLNEAIKDTINVAYNEFKYTAAVDLQLGPIPSIIVNAGQINQTLLNIVINSGQALVEKFKEIDGVKGIIRIKTYADDGFVHCIIEDNGPGVPEGLREKIFMPFFTTKPIGKGTGLWLGIVYDIIVNKHGGKIHVENSELGGAKFCFELPFVQE